MTLAEKTIEIAKTQIGVTEHPHGSNRGPEVDRYLKSVGLDASKGAYAWCAAFCSWAVQEATKIVGGPPVFKGSAGALALLTSNSSLRIQTPVAPCLAAMDHGEGKGHAFLITAVDGDSVETLEGNSDASGSRTGGSVVVRTRKISDCCGFLRIG